MRKWIYVGMGGAAGAILRFAAKALTSLPGLNGFPLGTLLVNLVGCGLLPWVLYGGRTGWLDRPYIRVGLSAGVLGALTTFSTFCREVVLYAAHGQVAMSLVYGVLSLGMGVAAALGGHAIVRRFAVAREKQ